MKPFLALFFLVFLAACGGNGQKSKDAYRPAEATTKSAHSDAFNRPFGVLLNYYYALKDDLVDEKDTLAINHAAVAMMVSVDSLPLNELTADSSVIATISALTMGISSELKGLVGEQGLQEKRKEFQLVSDQLYELIRAVRYDRTIIYHAYCPMAFSDQGAFWLSSSPEIKNPYIPKRMMDCGEVKDSVDFRGK